MREHEHKHRTVLDRAVTRLYAVEYPVLRRPAVSHGDPPTADLIAWAIDVYTFTLTAHVRQLLESFCLLDRNRHWPTTYLVARGMFELSGQARHVLRKLRTAIDKNDLPAAWALMHAASFGSKTVQHDTPTDPWPAPLHVMDDVRSLEPWMPGETRTEREKSAEDMYGHLSDFSHPNVGAFNQYVRFEERGDHVYVSMELVPNADPPDSEALISVAIALEAANGLLGIYAHHTRLASYFQSILEEIASDVARPAN